MMSRRPGDSFGEQLKAFRMAAGLTRIGLARRAGLDRRIIDQHEGGKCNDPRWSRLRRLGRGARCGVHAIDEREKGIATQLGDAEAKKAEAHKERDDFQHKNAAFDQERAALLKKTTDDAQTERQRLLGEARKDADALRAKRQDTLRNEATSEPCYSSLGDKPLAFSTPARTITPLD